MLLSTTTRGITWQVNQKKHNVSLAKKQEIGTRAGQNLSPDAKVLRERA